MNAGTASIPRAGEHRKSPGLSEPRSWEEEEYPALCVRILVQVYLNGRLRIMCIVS